MSSQGNHLADHLRLFSTNQSSVFFVFVSLSNAQRFAFFSKREHFDYKLKTDRQRDWTVHLCWCLGAEAIFHWFLYWFCGVWQLAQYNHSFTSSFNLITDTEHTVCVATFSLCFEFLSDGQLFKLDMSLHSWICILTLFFFPPFLLRASSLRKCLHIPLAGKERK